MKRRRLLLINPILNRHYQYPSPDHTFPSLALQVIRALTPETWDVEVIDENIETFRPIDCDLVGITAYTIQACRAYELAAQYRSRGTPVVMGGVHVTMMPDEAAEHADSLVLGEAELVWPQVIRDAEAGALQPRYEGTPCPPEKMVVLDHTLNSKQYKVAAVESSRGCPFDCEFCAVSKFNGTSYRSRSAADLLAEINTIRQKMFVFSDGNFFGSTREQVEAKRDFLQQMIDGNVRKRWGAQTSINIVDHPDVLQLAHQAGCRVLLIGFESLNPAALRGMNKGINVAEMKRHQDFKSIVKKIQDCGILVYGMFIYGADGDDPEALEHIEAFCRDSGMDVLELTVATPLPGTRLYERLLREKRLLRTQYPQDWELYNWHRIVFQPEGQALDEFYRRYIRGMGRLIKLFKRRHWQTLRRTRDPIMALVARGINQSLAGNGRHQMQVYQQALTELER